ncbi:MAG TPA: nuclear transport factor 2 family protein [Pyrinomonadaceae bacterium]|nr:nuclear transport factor 2 family protein [Pyrinomonadaceae bacterium]
MKSLLPILLTICALPGTAAAQDKKQAGDLKSMVETERAFARMAEEKGTREAFAAFIAGDGVLFRPGPVFGKKWMQDNPLPPSTGRPLLAWQPIFAFVSSAGDLGYTTGPWQYKKDIKDAQASAFGNFMTVWRKQKDDTWKFALDLGISNPEPKTVVPMWRPDKSQEGQESFKKVDQQVARSGLLDVERKFSKVSAELGARDSFLLYAAKDVRLFRDDHQPFVGKVAAADALAPVTGEWIWTPSFADVSVSGDLGYSYGTYELREQAGTLVEKGNYARVWKKVLGDWKLVVDVANPLPKK